MTRAAKPAAPKVVPTPVPEGSALGVEFGPGVAYIMRRDLAATSDLYIVARMHQMNGTPEDHAAVKLLAQKFAAAEAMERALVAAEAWMVAGEEDEETASENEIIRQARAALALARGGE